MAKTDLLSMARSSRYHARAYLFVQQGLDFTVRQEHGDIDESEDPRLHESRHVTGKQLCNGLRDLALKEYGLMARTVLGRWNIHSCADFGRIVFSMVEAGLMRKTQDDRMKDFADAYDFDEAFTSQLSLTEN